jgi:hypothetical protein
LLGYGEHGFGRVGPILLVEPVLIGFQLCVDPKPISATMIGVVSDAMSLAVSKLYPRIQA